MAMGEGEGSVEHGNDGEARWVAHGRRVEIRHVQEKEEEEEEGVKGLMERHGTSRA